MLVLGRGAKAVKVSSHTNHTKGEGSGGISVHLFEVDGGVHKKHIHGSVSTLGNKGALLSQHVAVV